MHSQSSDKQKHHQRQMKKSSLDCIHVNMYPFASSVVLWWIVGIRYKNNFKLLLLVWKLLWLIAPIRKKWRLRTDFVFACSLDYAQNIRYLTEEKWLSSFLNRYDANGFHSKDMHLFTGSKVTLIFSVTLLPL